MLLLKITVAANTFDIVGEMLHVRRYSDRRGAGRVYCC